MKIKVCDSLTGTGKTSAAIAMMNAHPEGRFLFVTPYLSEVERIKDACPLLHFDSPVSWEGYPKLQSLEDMLAAGRNIASTHALFTYYRPRTLELIQQGGYTLVLDEVMNVIEIQNVSKYDFDMIIKSGAAEMAEDGYHVRWLDDNYDGNFKDLMRKAQLNNLIYYNEILLFWSLPVATFECFKDAYLLTYLFHAQTQCYYYQLHNIEIEYIGTRQTDTGFEFCEKPFIPDSIKSIADKIHILDDAKLNDIGSDGRSKNPLNDCSLSNRWFRNRPPSYKGKKNSSALAKNMYNVFHNRWHCKGDDLIWTVFKTYSDFMGSRGYRKSFIPCSLRATNEYADRHYMAYCINVFFDPRLKNYFLENGAVIDEDAYALSEMIQWVWRSAIRCGEEVWLYVPSRRMRTLFTQWLDRLSQGEMW